MNSAYQAFIGPPPLPPTHPDIEGPFYLAGAPLLVDGVFNSPNQFTRKKLAVSGRVLSPDGTSLDAVLDIWQADGQGNYDEKGYKLRGKIRCLSDTGYGFQTWMPGDYQIADNPPDFRCAHIHVKLTADGCKPLTTQLYFADTPYNDTDHWFDPTRCIQFAEKTKNNGTFDFVLEKL